MSKLKDRSWYLACLLGMASLSFVSPAQAWNSLQDRGRCQQTNQSCRSTIGNAGGANSCCDPRSPQILTCEKQNECKGGSTYRWTTLPVPWTFNHNNMAGKEGFQGKTLSSIESALKTAWDAWTKPSCTGFTHNYGGQSTARPNVQDRKLVAFLASSSDWASFRLPIQALAVTRPATRGNGQLFDADIIFNPRPGGSTWGIIPNVQSREMDFADVAAHEIGHALGFGHAGPRSSLMYFSIRSRGPVYNGLPQDEKLGVCAVYPVQKCTSDSQCGRCRTCNNGTCTPVKLTSNSSVCKGCKYDSACGGGICASIGGQNRCLQACQNGCCPDGYQCKSISGKQLCAPNANVCPEASCSSDAQCGNREKCQGGKCKKICLQDSNCSTGFICQSGVCTKATPGKMGEACNNNKPCDSGLVCGNTSKGQICTTRCGAGAGGFGNGSLGSQCNGTQCSTGGRCLRFSNGGNICLKLCRSASTCSAEGGRCYRIGNVAACLCRQDSECKSGYGCNKTVFANSGLGACAKKGGAACPSGYLCQSSFCTPGKAQCGDGTCSPGENCSSCAKDCKCATGQTCKNGQCTGGNTNTCGNGTCDANENCSSCLQDCKCPTNHTCQSGTCKLGSTGPKCGDSKCEGNENCGTCPSDCACSADQTCKNNKCETTQGGGGNRCGDGTCDANEDCTGCPRDCACPSGQVCQNGTCALPDCGDFQCGTNENCQNCPSDCACPQGQICQAEACVNPPVCGNGQCEAGENCTDCIADCPCAVGQSCQAGNCLTENNNSGTNTGTNSNNNGSNDANGNNNGNGNNNANGSNANGNNANGANSANGSNANSGTGDPGSLGSPCRQDGTCNPGLYCENGLCLNPAVVQGSGCACQSSSEQTPGIFFLTLLIGLFFFRLRLRG